MLFDAQRRAIARESRTRKITWTSAEQTRYNHSRGDEREWDRSMGGMSRLPEMRWAEEAGDRISSEEGKLSGKGFEAQESVDHYTCAVYL
jgi:hypothetical protein